MGAHCWAGRREDLEERFGWGSAEYAESWLEGWKNGTCLLPDGHEGGHEFTNDDETMLSFVNTDTETAMHNVQAKFRLDSILTNATGRTLTFQPVNGPVGSENAEWSKWTPSGELRMLVTTDAFADATPGAEFLLTFTPAP